MSISMRNKISRALDEGGFKLLCRRSINFVYRNFLEDFDLLIEREYNGVQVYADRFLEPIIPGRETGDNPDYERTLVKALEKNVDVSDDVTIIGGGYGVTGFKAAEITDGDVVAYEASKERCEIIDKSRKLNDSRLEVIQAIVGEEKDVWGKSGGAKRIDPSHIPECDVLELDCEGSEIDILENIGFRPRKIIVETHGHLGAPTEEVRDLLKQKEYSIKSERNVENDANSGSLDVKILVAERNQ